MKTLNQSVCEIADAQNYMGMDRSQSSIFQTSLENDQSLKNLAKSEGRQWTRKYIKDTLLNDYSKRKRYISLDDIISIVPELSNARVLSGTDPNIEVVKYVLEGQFINCTSVSIDKWETAIRRFDDEASVNLAFITLADQSQRLPETVNIIERLGRNKIIGLIAKPNQSSFKIPLNNSGTGLTRLSEGNELNNFNQIAKELDISINSIGLKIGGDLLVSFVSALIAKPFVILTGLSGSGKTKLAEALAVWVTQNIHEQVCMVAVGADWTNNEPLLGYADAINKGHYCAPASGILRLLDHAHKTPKAPHFLILDEMNLSHVERYFADFLSAMESSEPELALHGQETLKADNLDVPARIALPRNLFIVGTVNVDETTYMFSPKVLDRANVIEFRVSAEQMNDFLAAPASSLSVKDLAGEGAHYAEAFVARAQLETNLDQDVATQLKQDLMELFKPLAEVGSEFGYRSAKEIARFVAIHCELSGDNWNYKDALDAQVMQKLMPKLHGSARKLCGVLNTLEKFAVEHALPLTQDKVARMQKRLKDEGFTSFAEN
jgi:hypothetical protein